MWEMLVGFALMLLQSVKGVVAARLWLNVGGG
jgi:hypothetical protein